MFEFFIILTFFERISLTNKKSIDVFYQFKSKLLTTLLHISIDITEEKILLESSISVLFYTCKPIKVCVPTEELLYQATCVVFFGTKNFSAEINGSTVQPITFNV